MINSNAYQHVCEEIYQAAIACGRSPNEIKLIAVTKQMTKEDVCWLYGEGQRDFAESRYQDSLLKLNEVPESSRWHFIGNLQSNKIRKVIEKFDLIHAVDSLELARKIAMCSRELGIQSAILLQSNTSGEDSKQGLSPFAWERHVDELVSLCEMGLLIQGLMTIAPLTANEQIARQCFANLRHLRDRMQKLSDDALKLPHLSMGMSRDFHWGILEGATMVRIGSRLKSSHRV